MWVEHKKFQDERPDEAILRAQARLAAGSFLRDMYYWLADRASAQSTWDMVPPWAERIPSDVSWILSCLQKEPDEDMSRMVSATAKRVCRMLDQIDNPPMYDRFEESIKNYWKYRKTDGQE